MIPRHDFRYTPGGATLRAFLKDGSFFTGVMGPVGSGKSVACMVKMFMKAMAQKPGPDGVRRTRWAVIRNTFPELKTTSIKTWLDWFPERVFGKFNWSPPMTHVVKIGDVEMEVIFLALDRAEDVRKLLSLELTGAFINEAREILKEVLDAVTMRVGRYPSMRDGGPTWYGVIADTNSPHPEHWWPIMSGLARPPEWMSESEAEALIRPAGWSFYVQPPGMIERKDAKGRSTYEPNPEAENAAYLTPDYYPRIVTGKRPSWVNVYVLNRLDEVFEGQPVYPTFNRDVHVAKERLAPFPGHMIYVGLDFGLTPAATFGQYVRGRDFVLRELVCRDMGARRFGERIKAFAAEHFPGFDFIFTGDPAGDSRAQTDETTPFEILRNHHGIHARPAVTNDPLVRREAVEGRLDAMVDGAPGYLVSPCCSTLIRGFEGGYHVKASGDAAKDMFSHVHDAEQYRMLGRGAGREAVRGKAQAASVGKAAVAINPRSFSSMQGRFQPRGFPR